MYVCTFESMSLIVFAQITIVVTIGVWRRLVVVKVTTEWRVWRGAAVVRFAFVIIHFR